MGVCERGIEPRAGRHARFGLMLAGTVLVGLAGWEAAPVLAQTPVTLNGPPVQVRPTAMEPGVPAITINPGTASPFPTGGTGTGSSDDGSGDTGDGTGTGGTGSPGGNVGDSPALGRMLATSWGAAAAANAQAVGVNPSALAATCVLESGCRNVSTSGAQGAFQMFSGAYNEGLRTALAANPELASQVNGQGGGANNPNLASIAASGYLIQATRMLQNAGISDPTVLDTRGYYNFGPRYAVGLAQAQDADTMGSVLAGAPSNFFSGNGISPNTTVGQWRASVVAKIGTAANQSVRTS